MRQFSTRHRRKLAKSIKAYRSRAKTALAFCERIESLGLLPKVLALIVDAERVAVPPTFISRPAEGTARS